MRLPEKIEPYIFQFFVHTSALRVQCEQTLNHIVASLNASLSDIVWNWLKSAD